MLICDDERNLRELVRLSLGDEYAFVEAGDAETFAVTEPATGRQIARVVSGAVPAWPPRD